ncbi:alpha/beta fold hydrolase [Beijerinckia sp. L45]|uniref:alpha/beta fold hydrolase n=1 Tax=Beijerinckia sp. L45 TaxID=1641855 RepID=UPI00131B2805|nr:alpha/beta fold hydrolase [Beijerinckia sp. L45]
MDIPVKGGTITATQRGEGYPLVLLHSLLADRGSFDRIVDALSAQFRVITIDLPGFGGSSPMTGGLADFAERLADAIRQVAGAAKPMILGNGFGGFLALQLAILHPDLPARLILADCGAAFSEPGRQAFRNMANAAAQKGLQAIEETAMRRLFAADFQAANPDLMAERRAAFLRTDIGVFQAACQALAGLDLRPALGGVTMPVLVLAGEQDEATPPAMARELASLLPDATFTLLPGCAHVPQLQNPRLFLDAIEGALVSVAMPASG